MEQSHILSSLGPAEVRALIRQEDPRITTTTGLANGKSQCVACMVAGVSGIVHVELFVPFLYDLEPYYKL